MTDKLFRKTGIISLFLFFSLVFVTLSSGGEGESAGTEQRSVLVSPPPVLPSQSLVLLSTRNLQQNRPINPSFEDEFQRPTGRKSVTKAMLLSLLLPGAGELYAENATGSRIFLGLEGSIWAGFFGFTTYGAWKKADYKGYAAAHAGINLDSKTDAYFENITYYDSRDEYNQFARLYHGSDATIYPENDFWNWNWDSQDSKGRFRDLRNQSKTAYRRALFMVGLAAVNRVVSVLDAARSVKKFNRKLSSEFSSVNPTGLRFSLDANPFAKNPHYYFKVKKRF